MAVSFTCLKLKVVIAMGLLTWLLGHATSANPGEFRSPVELREMVMEAMKANPAISNVRAVENSDTSIESTIGDNNVVTDVGNLFDCLRTYPGEDPGKSIDQLIQSAVELDGHEVNAERLVPLVRTSGYVAEIGTDVPHANIVGDLVLTYAFDHSNGYAYATRDELASLELSSPRSVAIDNLAKALPRLTIEDDGGPIVLYSIDESLGLSPSLMLLDAFWEQTGKRFPRGSIFLNPRRDQIILIDKRAPAAMDSARRMIDATFADGFALQSRGIFERVNGEIVLLEYH
jgi:hypothetical protein